MGDPQKQIKKESMSSLQAKFKRFPFYLHFRCRRLLTKAAHCIQTFGGVIEPFLDPSTVRYVLTDVRKDEWDTTDDSTLQSAKKFGIKLLSFTELLIFCQKYLASQSSSDDDDASEVQFTELRGPYIKYEDGYARYAPTARELIEWPDINLNDPITCGQSIFGFATRPQNQLTPEELAQYKRRRHRFHCELCKCELTDNLDEHLKSTEHLQQIENTDWTAVKSVINSLPALETLVRPKNTPTVPMVDDTRDSFVCLHKLETIDQLFLNTAK